MFRHRHSEPGSGSDLFAAKTKATKTDGGWHINGSKIWTTSAHIADYMLGLFRTSPPTKENRRHGLTQFLVDMKTPGITVNPIYQMAGHRGVLTKWCSRTPSCPTTT